MHVEIESSGDRNWYAVQVRHHHEARVATALDHKGYDPFLPSYRVRRRWSDRTVEIDSPLFPGYVFCRFDASQRRLPVVTTPGVIRIVSGPGGPVPVEEREIAAVRAVVASGIASRPWPYLKAGQRVRIRYGALEGIEGVFLEIRNQQRLIVSVSLLQRSIQVDIDSSMVVPVNAAWRPAQSA